MNQMNGSTYTAAEQSPFTPPPTENGTFGTYYSYPVPPSQNYSLFSPYRQQQQPPPVQMIPELEYQDELYPEQAQSLLMMSPYPTEHRSRFMSFSEGKKKRGGPDDFRVKYKTEVMYTLIVLTQTDL